jgi:hypothetical protein
MQFLSYICVLRQNKTMILTNLLILIFFFSYAFKHVFDTQKERERERIFFLKHEEVPYEHKFVSCVVLKQNKISEKFISA